MSTDAADGGSLSELATTSHRRLNALTGEWVLVSPHRALRPWLGQVEKIASASRPAYDPTCYLCPGNERAGGVRNPQYTSTFVFDNDYPALLTDAPNVSVDQDGLLVARGESGVCRVVCFSPRHDVSLPDMTVDAIRGVVDEWAHQYEVLGARDDVNHVQIFENRGQMMGASNPHPHCQIWAQQSVPLVPAREGERQREHHASTGRTLLHDYISIELKSRARIVYENDAFVAVVPFWALWPFEVMLVSRRAVPSIAALDDAERSSFADAMKRITMLYDRIFETPFPYSAGIHQAPTDGMPHPEWHLHMHFYPPLLRSATIRKFLVGYEMLAEPQRDLTPESAAERLRSLLDEAPAATERP